MKSIAFHNLGCKVNSYEIEVMRQNIQNYGYEIVDFEQKADVYVVNTCTVTNMADRKSRQMLHRAKQLNPDAVVVAVGCYVQTGREVLEADEAVDLLVGNNQKSQLPQILQAYLEEKKVNEIPDINRPCEYENMTLTQTAEHTRAYIKVQDGCNQFCSYCLIPYARGRVRSRDREEILKEVRGLAEKGFAEIVVTGIHVGSYGIDFDDAMWQQGKCIPKQHEGKEDGHPIQDYDGCGKLLDLVEDIAKIPGIERIRLGSLEPRVVTEENVKRMAALPSLCPHFHLSLQSGCDETLQRMNRHYSTEEYLASVALLRKYFDRPAITTDVIVGFPGETEGEFEITRQFLERVEFYEMHIFKYSKRTGTRAAVMKDQVPEPEKASRSDELLAMEARQSKSFREKYVGASVKVLIEEEKRIAGKKYLTGFTMDYVRVAIPSDSDNAEPGKIVEVKVEGFLTDTVLCGALA